jgi:hypothetical protein
MYKLKVNMCLLFHVGMETTKQYTKVNQKTCGCNHLCIEDKYKSNFTIPQYVDTLYKIKKGDQVNWTIIYHAFTHEEYSRLLLNEVREEKEHEIYLNISLSQLHKVGTHPTIFPCS